LPITNQHLLIINGHNNHVTLKAKKQAQELRLDMIVFPTHTSYALWSLDVSCFKPLKTTFRKVTNVVMEKNNYMELDNVTLVEWVG
jgi:hypothetical protein